MIELVKSQGFDDWLVGLKDSRALARILVRIDRLALGNAGDVKSIGSGISEMRIDYGPGYRIYFKRQGSTIILLLCGGDKSSQPRDIERAKIIARQWKD